MGVYPFGTVYNRNCFIFPFAVMICRDRACLKIYPPADDTVTDKTIRSNNNGRLQGYVCGSPAKSCVFIASFRGFTYTASTFHHMPETLFQCGIEGGTWSFHRRSFVSPVWGWGWEDGDGERKVKGARFTLDPAPGKGFRGLVKGETYFHIKD
jgi:hypothetical protein